MNLLFTFFFCDMASRFNWSVSVLSLITHHLNSKLYLLLSSESRFSREMKDHKITEFTIVMILWNIFHLLTTLLFQYVSTNPPHISLGTHFCIPYHLSSSLIPDHSNQFVTTLQQFTKPALLHSTSCTQTELLPKFWSSSARCRIQRSCHFSLALMQRKHSKFLYNLTCTYNATYNANHSIEKNKLFIFCGKTYQV